MHTFLVGVIYFILLVVRPEDVGLELDEYVPSDERGRYAPVVTVGRRNNAEREPLLSDSEDEGQGKTQIHG